MVDVPASATTRRERLIKAGHEILARAEHAKASGQIRDFQIVVLERDPEIIDHIVILHHDPRQFEGRYPMAFEE